MSISKQVEEDILNWAINWVEVKNEFYDHKFAVCPYAKRARLRGETDIRAWGSGSIRTWILNNINELIQTKHHPVMLLALPPRVRFYPGFRKFAINLNKLLVPHGYFTFPGRAVTTKSRYKGLLNSGPYVIIGINTLDQVLPAVENLKSAGYYNNWSDEHYAEIVERRQRLYEKYKNI